MVTAQIQQSNPNIQPTESELLEMSQRAMTVVRLLEELRRLNAPETEQSREAPSNAMQQSPDDPRPPKRPWEDIDDTTQPTSETNNFTEVGLEYISALPNQFVDYIFLQQQQYSSVDVKPQSTAEQDMELIRTKRATSTAGSTGPAGQPKSKYRKRSVSPAGLIANLASSWLNSFRVFRSNSGLHRQGNAILATSKRHPNGAVVRMEPEPFAMRVACVCYFSPHNWACNGVVLLVSSRLRQTHAKEGQEWC